MQIYSRHPCPGVSICAPYHVGRRVIYLCRPAGEFDRFDVFAGPIIDIDGNVVVPDGERMTQGDIDQFGPPLGDATYGMYWWNQNIIADLPNP